MDLDLEGGETLVYGLKEEIDILKLIEMYRPLQPYQQYKNLFEGQREALKGWKPWIKGEKHYFDLESKEFPKITLHNTENDTEVIQLHNKWTALNNECIKYYKAAAQPKPATKAKTKKSKKSKSKSPP